MSFIPNSELTPDPVTLLRCRQHAARIFSDDQFRLLPKTKFLFHVSFEINWNVVNPKSNLSMNNLPRDKINAFLVETLKDEINLLVKDISLPSYSVQHDVLNQYNRKKVAQYQHKFNEVEVTFHDDNMGLINQVWQLYYKYYYADPTVAFKKRAYNRNATKSSDYIKDPYGYTGRRVPFFKSIMIYQMSRKEFVSYQLINPVITSWTGGKLGYHENNAHHFDMKLAYEAVAFNTGYINHRNDGVDVEMENFGLLSPLYDSTLSPLHPTDPTYEVNGSGSPSFARVPFGSHDPSMPVDTSNLTDNVIPAPLPPVSDEVLYQSLAAVTPPIEGIKDMYVPIGENPADTTEATEATIANTSLDTTVEPTTAEHAANY